MKRVVQKNEDGLVAILVATIIMIIMTLVTLGFARLMQNEQRQAIDRSLSTQAFYAAESGINDAVTIIQDPLKQPVIAKKTCDTSVTYPGVVSSSVDSSYSCLLINPAPISLEYSPGRISTNMSTSVPINTVGGATVNKIVLDWDPDASPIYPPYDLPKTGLVCGGSGPFLQSSSWPSQRPGILRIDLVPTNALNRDTLVNSMISVYLYPTSCPGPGVGTVAASYGGSLTPYKGQIIPAFCKAKPYIPTQKRLCQVTFVMGAGLSTTNYFLRMKSIYHNSSVSVRIFNAAGKQLEIDGAQVEIDSTGRVADVVRRIKVRKPINKTYAEPEFVLQSMDSICKQLKINPALPLTPSSVTGIGGVGAVDVPGSSCGL